MFHAVRKGVASNDSIEETLHGHTSPVMRHSRRTERHRWEASDIAALGCKRGSGGGCVPCLPKWGSLQNAG